MKIEQHIEYDADYAEIADEFCDHDSEYQAEAINRIGLQFTIWAHDKRKMTGTYIQLLEIAEELNEKGRWFIKTLFDYMEGKAEMRGEPIAWVPLAKPYESEGKNADSD